MGLLTRIFGRASQRVWRVEQDLLSGLGLSVPPVAIQWIATNACELTCPHCYSQAGKRLTGELSLDEACRLIFDPLVDLGRPQMVLAGGEPLLRPDFADIIEALKEREIPWALHSHGRHVKRWRQAFASHPPLMVAISFDGPPEEHDAFRGLPGSFAAALEAMAILRDLGVDEVVAGTTVHRGNADLLDRMLPHFLDSAANAWGLHLVTPEGRAAGDRELLPTAAQIRRVARFAGGARAFIRVELDNEWGSAGRLDPLYRDSSFFCGAGRISAVVSATGLLMPCTTTDPKEAVGSVRDLPLQKLWAEGFAAFRKSGSSLEAETRDCWLQTRNGCSCRVDAFGTLDLQATLRQLVEAQS